MKFYLLITCVFINLKAISQEIELIHNISSDQIYSIQLDNNETLDIYLNFYSPSITDYKSPPLFFVSGWYEKNDEGKNNLVGIYRPLNNLTAFVLKDNKQINIDYIEENRLNVDTTKYREKFYFPLNGPNKETKKAIWFYGNKTTTISNIDFDNKNLQHKVFIKGGDLNKHVNRTIDISDFVTQPFGKNDLFLEDFNISLHSSYIDKSENLHLLMHITNEYVIPSSLSSGGYYYLLLDKNQIIRENKYIETYNQGKYISIIDENSSNPSKQRFLIISDWSDNKTIGSFFIENSKIEIEKKWTIP